MKNNKKIPGVELLLQNLLCLDAFFLLRNNGVTFKQKKINFCNKETLFSVIK